MRNMYSTVTALFSIYKRVSEKLKFWQSLVKSGESRRLEQDAESKLKKDLQEFQCDVATNSEICHIGEIEIVS